MPHSYRRIDQSIDAAVELGCGYGTFTIPVAQRICGSLHTVDLESDMVSRGYVVRVSNTQQLH